MAAQLGAFKVIGDSNIRNAFSTRLKLSERISGQSTEFVSATAYSSGLLALSDLAGASTVLVSFLVNGLVDATELCTTLEEVDKVLEFKVREYMTAIRMAATVNSDTKFFMLPPLTRTTPVWIESKLANVTALMTTHLEGSANLFLLPPLVVLTKDLETDGIHLNRSTQSRLFNHIMDEIFPGERSVKVKNISRERPEFDEEMSSTPAKNKPAKDQGGLPMETELEPVKTCNKDLVLDSFSPPKTSIAPSPTKINVSPSSVCGIENRDITDVRNQETGTDNVENPSFQNPDLQQLYQMLSNKMDRANSGSAKALVKVDQVEALASKTAKQVECNTMILKSLHLRTAKQAELLDSHSNSLNLNVVMISGIPSSLFRAPDGDLPRIKTVMDKLIKFTPLLTSGIKFATYAKYIKHPIEKLPNIKAFFINADTALAFRDAANKLRIEKKEFWATVYVSNDPTKSTRVRICILQAIARRLSPLPANAGKTIFVSRFDVKPQLCFKFAGRVERRFDFVAAIEKYRTVLKPEDKEAARKVAGKTFSDDDLRQFIVL